MTIYSTNLFQNKNFYVYQYLRSRKSKYGAIGTPYYIGKGIGNRAFCTQHRIKPNDKNNIQFVSQNITEANALQIEVLLIHLYGRIDLGIGCLRNMTNGGDGISGAKRSAETRNKQSIHPAHKRNLGKTYEEIYGVEKTKTIKQKMSKGLKGKSKPLGFSKKVANSNKNRTLSPVSRLKISKSLKLYNQQRKQLINSYLCFDVKCQPVSYGQA